MPPQIRELHYHLYKLNFAQIPLHVLFYVLCSFEAFFVFRAHSFKSFFPLSVSLTVESFSFQWKEYEKGVYWSTILFLLCAEVCI